MKFDINEFRTDKEAKAAGVWVDFGGGASFKIASFDNQDFAEAFKKRVDPYTRMGREAPADEQITIMVDCMARYIVLDWKGVYDGEEEYLFSRENAVRLLTEVEPIRDRIIEEARKIENFRKREAKKIEGNSKSASGGKQATATE